LNFSFNSAEIDLTDDRYRKFAFFTDGRKLQKSKDDSYQEIAAHWNGTQLVTDEKTSQGSTMSRTFELASDGKQFFETIHVDRGKSKGTLVIRYVYDVSAGASSQATHETDPDQPVLKRHAASTTSAPDADGTQTAPPADPDQPVLKRKADDSSAPSPQSAPTAPDTDPDKPVLKRKAGNSSSSSQ
jgi:hypothetical protein